jgi:hypothetical protein
MGPQPGQNLRPKEHKIPVWVARRGFHICQDNQDMMPRTVRLNQKAVNRPPLLFTWDYSNIVNIIGSA